MRPDERRAAPSPVADPIGGPGREGPRAGRGTGSSPEKAEAPTATRAFAPWEYLEA